MCYARMNMFLTAITQVAAPAFVEATISAIFTITEAISPSIHFSNSAALCSALVAIAISMEYFFYPLFFLMFELCLFKTSIAYLGVDSD